MTVNQYKFLFKSIGDQHLFIKNTQFGDPPKFVNSDEDGLQYPAFYQVLVDTVMREQTIETTFTLIIADLVQPDNSNLDEVLSDTRSELQDIITLLRQGGENFIILGDPQILPFKDRYSDRVTGHQCDVTIETLNDSSLCNIPFEDFLSPGQFFPPSSDNRGFKCSDLLECQLWNDLVNQVVGFDEQILDLNSQINDIHIVDNQQNTDITQNASDIASNQTQINDVIVSLNALESDIGAINSELAITTNQIAYGNGTGTSISSSNKFTFDESLLFVDADTQITGLAGSGNRMVIASADGTLSTQSIPSGASLTSTYVGFGDGSNNLTGSSKFTYSNNILTLNSSFGWYAQIGETNGFGLTAPQGFLFFSPSGKFNHNAQSHNFYAGDVGIGTAYNHTPNASLEVTRSTIGCSIRASNNSYNLNGDGPLMVYDGVSTGVLSLGYSTTASHNIRAFTDILRFEGGAATASKYHFIGTANITASLRIGDITAATHTLEVAGDVQITSLSGINSRMVEADSTGNLSATTEIIDAWITDTTIITELENVANWDVSGQWLGTITNAYQGQQHYDFNYHFILVDDNSPIRTARA